MMRTFKKKKEVLFLFHHELFAAANPIDILLAVCLFVILKYLCALG